MDVNEGSTNDSFMIESSNATIAGLLNNSVIKNKILSGEFKIKNKRGRSKVWDVFGTIENESGEELESTVACRTCNNVYKFNQKSTSNLVKHKCYVITNSKNNATFPKIEVDSETKLNAVRVVTQWTLQNCRSFKIVEDSGLKELAEFLISVGAKYGENVDVKKLLPHPTTISRNIEKLYNIYFNKIKEEINLIKKIGFGLTSDLWTDNYLRRTYLSLTMHFIKDGQLFKRVLGLMSMEGVQCTGVNINSKIRNLLNDFNCELDDNVYMVTDRGSNMVAAFRSCNHIFCINHLLHNTLEKSIKEITAIKELCGICSKLVKYFKKSGINSSLQTTLKSFAPTRWNSIYYLLLSIEKNWSDITNILQEKNELHRINNINLSYISAVVKLLQFFEETSKKLEDENYATLLLTYVHIHHLKKVCVANTDDLEIIKQFKEKLNTNLQSIVLENMTIYHRIALFLFPPANTLIQFTETEKNLVKAKCKTIMKDYLEEISEQEDQSISTSRISEYNAELFGDFVTPTEIIGSEEIVHNEICAYENTNIVLHNDFNAVHWWYLHRTEFPLMYKLSCNILAIPASSAASERTFSAARNLITEKRTSISFNSSNVNKIMFLHSNINKNDISTELHRESVLAID